MYIERPIPSYIKTNNTDLKKIIFILLLSLTSVNAQDSVSIQLISRSLPDKVMLRWAVDEPTGWKTANELGFMVERSTISRNGTAVVPIERKILTTSPLRPQPLEAWELLAKQDQNAAILAQALYGDSFETITPNPGILGKISAVNEELEQRYTFALIAAEQNYEAALLAGWGGLTDSSVIQGERYVYRVFVAPVSNSTSEIKEASTYAGTELFESLPKPLQLSAIFKDSQALLSWIMVFLVIYIRIILLKNLLMVKLLYNKINSLFSVPLKNLLYQIVCRYTIQTLFLTKKCYIIE